MTDITPADLKEILGLKFAPVDEQSNVINLSKDGVHLVLAGAGSGKTETMSLRALWLVATQGVRPEQVLGLTFTRKAARELAERFRQRIALVRANRNKFKALGISVDHLDDDDHGFSTPTVSTYNAFASEIFTEHAARIGWDSDSPVITEATAFAIAREVVTTSTDVRLGDYGFSLNAVVDAVIRLAAELGEFDVTNDDAVIDYARRVAALKDLPGKVTQTMNTFREKFAAVGALEVLIPLAREFIAEKKRRGVVEFSDQVTFARRIIREFEDVATAYKNRFAVVILDEYQDTSYSQTSLFAQLFGAGQVTAVGDPNQSIYGWRGASPANVASFYPDFGVVGAAASEVSTLATSWRNGTKILAAANTILRNRTAELPLDVGQLSSFPDATTFDIDGVFAASTSAEASQLADWFLSHLRPDSSTRTADEPLPTMAMLIQTRTHLDAFLKEFDAKQVPYRLLGVAGILGNPFIADLYCALSVIAEPGKGSRLVRLLGGARWQMSVSDLWALHNHARNVAKSYTTREQRSRLGSSLVDDESDSLIDALDSLRYTARDAVETTNEYDKPVVFSDEGWTNLVDAAEFFHDLRRHVDLSVPDMVSLTASALQLDIEGIASLHHSPAAYREAFDDLVHAYLAIPTSQSLRGFVSWVSEVERLERMTPRTDEPEPGIVQVLTVHAAKGLEWDVVALPRWTQPPPPAEGPPRGDKSRAANEMGWLQLGALPHSFRPDAGHLPPFRWESATTIEELLTESKAYTERLKTDLILPEERRLMYVAVTRARHRLWISGAHFEGKGKNAKIPSTYWEELTAAQLIRAEAVEPVPESNPDGDGTEIVWPPLDPLGTPAHRAAYDAAAGLIESSTDQVNPADLRAIDQLLAHESLGKSDVPIRIPASRYAEWSMDLASVREGNRRPIPTRPYRAARLGTEVHLWIERGAVDDDFVDGWDEANDLPETDEAMQKLKDAYLASRWPRLTPAHTELEILLPRGRHVIVCKIDAVYQIDGRWVVVDWKTGAKPTEEQKDAKALQLVLYRRALAEWLGIDVTKVDAVLYYIAHDWEWTIERDRLDRLDALPPID